ncbi:MAG: hypothetical protein JXR31_15805 [Prolixibacteraceae bacterium]|nr:hypothetical protein [Prolixibacteraceae bacterium]MBN2775720.1 hypothetical protein [Prolixibacteraceae bacterium]
MTSDEYTLIKELKSGIAELINRYELLEGKNLKLKETVLELENKIKSLENENSELVKKYENLRLARFFESGYEDNRMAKLKINKLLREIDKCIALLNK